ncbi:Hypothetical protein D9617_6g094050 [Elsinoe fawcettii]|nr:Hypothetical protein D9617_6g094050 [Elsinoe fawcettii]
MKCVVGWNALVEFLCSRREYDAAFKVFNEMKKRGQSPDAITITLFMRGLAENPVTKQQVTFAGRIYESLEAENSKVKRSIIHTNAVLQVYMNAGDMEAVWKVISALPEEGADAMDRITFTTLFRGFRERVLEIPEENSERDALVEQYRSDQQQLWYLAIDKWRKGRLRIDAQLVGSHLHMLLTRPDVESAKDVLRCVEETTGISMHRDHQGTKDISPGSNKDKTALKGKLLEPDCLMLSSLITACTILLDTPTNESRAAHSYWNLLAKELGVLPDNDNYKTYLRHTIKALDSAQAAETIQQLKQDVKDGRQDQRLNPTPSIYTLALTACAAAAADESHVRAGQRSRRPPGSIRPDTQSDSRKTGTSKCHATLSALENANTILDALKGDLPMYDSRSFKKYLSCAVSSHSPPQIYDALRKLEPFVETLLHQLESSPRPRKHNRETKSTTRSPSTSLETGSLVKLYAATLDLMASKEGVKFIEDSGRDIAELERLFRFAHGCIERMDRHNQSAEEADIDRRRIEVPFGKRSVYDRVYHRIVKQGTAGTGEDGRELYRFLRAWESTKGTFRHTAAKTKPVQSRSKN